MMQPRRVVRHTVEMRFEADRVRIDLAPYTHMPPAPSATKEHVTITIWEAPYTHMPPAPSATKEHVTITIWEAVTLPSVSLPVSLLPAGVGRSERIRATSSKTYG
ncbi:hypothetical protein AK812_SmicGene23712 [Symbiodinium microadriaticum]|uniref:Uncharacterized protein n=1 Tax=Symbiodinium microadriaticum TaxID=2951 RepID=A0A1Q9DGG2_SYMMI|nr:hypothetical protein AK812_SmicGene23712 [Symbiodinium microadriaticum]